MSDERAVVGASGVIACHLASNRAGSRAPSPADSAVGLFLFSASQNLSQNTKNIENIENIEMSDYYPTPPHIYEHEQTTKSHETSDDGTITGIVPLANTMFSELYTI